MKIAVDINVLVRYLTWDDEVQATQAAEALEAVAAGGDFADGVILDDMQRTSCEFLATFDRDFASRSESSKVVLLGA